MLIVQKKMSGLFSGVNLDWKLIVLLDHFLLLCFLIQCLLNFRYFHVFHVLYIGPTVQRATFLEL